MKPSFLHTASLFAAAFSLVGSQAFSQTTAMDTSFYRSDLGHSGYSATTLPPILSVLWQTTFPGITKTYSSPAIANGVLYFGASGHVFAVNAKDGSIKWQYPKDGSSATGNFNDAPAVADGKVFIGSDSNNLSVFDAQSGDLLWQVPTTGIVNAAPVVDNGVVFFGSGDDHIYAIRESDQSALWGGQFHTSGPIFTSPTVSDGILCFADADSNIYGVSERDGHFLWTYRPTGGVAVGSPVYHDNTLLSASTSTVLVLSMRSGEVRSTIQMPANIVSPPTVGDTAIYVSTSDQSIYSLTARGSVLWHVKLPDLVTVPMVLTDSCLIAVTQRGVIYALDPSSGDQIWSYALQDAIVQPGDTSDITRDTVPQTSVSAAPMAANGVLYVLTNDGTLTALSGSAADHVPPVALAVSPKEGSTVAGANIPFQVFVADTGSGINPRTALLTVDSAYVPIYYDPAYSEVSVQYSAKHTGSISLDKIILPTIPDGEHTAILKIADWRGNVLTKTWTFTVDNTLNPAGSPAPTPITAGSSLGGSSDAQSVGGNAGGSDLGPFPGAAASVPGAPGGGAAGSGGGGSSSSGGSPGNAGYHPGPVAPPSGYPGAGGGGGGTGGGGIGFPPPPPI